MYNAAAMFEVMEIAGGTDKLDGILLTKTPEAVDKLFDIFLCLAKNGNAARKYIGYDCDELPGKEAVAALTTVDDIARMRDAVMNAIMTGVGREIKNDEDVEIDLGLEELNVKKKRT
jgi:hypothetical protein